MQQKPTFTPNSNVTTTPHTLWIPITSSNFRPNPAQSKMLSTQNLIHSIIHPNWITYNWIT